VAVNTSQVTAIVVADDVVGHQRHEGVLEEQREDDGDDRDLRHAPGAETREQDGGQNAKHRMEQMSEDRNGGDAGGDHHRQHGVGEIRRGDARLCLAVAAQARAFRRKARHAPGP
jgi:hypothetical protein